MIKSRVGQLRHVGSGAVAAHLGHIVRDGVTRDGNPGVAYGPKTDAADLSAFEERGNGDHHQFRFIVSLEDAQKLEDLRDYTRALMRMVSADLETPLD